MRVVVSLVIVALLLSGCGGSRPAPAPTLRGAIASASCHSQPLARAPLAGEIGVCRAGPLTLSLGQDLAQIRNRHLAHPESDEAIALVTGGLGSSSTMLIPIGNTLRGCPATEPFASLPASALPFLGVACGRPNSVRCDRIGVGVTLDRDATLIVVQVAGRLVTLSPPSPGSDLWQGYLQGAGPEYGPLRVHSPQPDRRWFGSPELHPKVRVTAFFADGSVASSAATVLLHPGFG